MVSAVCEFGVWRSVWSWDLARALGLFDAAVFGTIYDTMFVCFIQLRLSCLSGPSRRVIGSGVVVEMDPARQRRRGARGMGSCPCSQLCPSHLASREWGEEVSLSTCQQGREARTQECERPSRILSGLQLPQLFVSEAGRNREEIRKK